MPLSEAFAEAIASAWPADAIRLDAFDSAPGAGAFYAKCGLRENGDLADRQPRLITKDIVIAS